MKRSSGEQFYLEEAKHSYGELNENKSIIRESGNSDVDVSVDIDTTPIAFAMLCSLVASNQMSEKEFKAAVRDLEAFKNKQFKNPLQRNNNTKKVRRKF